MPIVDDELIGDAWPQAHPSSDPMLYGHVCLAPEGAFEARSLQTFALTYTAGRFGLDDTGSIKIVHRYSNDCGRLQTEDPAAINYVSAIASNGSRLQLVYENGGEQRPWYRSLTVFVKNDCRTLRQSIHLNLKPVGDNPIWVRVTTEDGCNAWSSPIFLYRQDE